MHWFNSKCRTGLIDGVAGVNICWESKTGPVLDLLSSMVIDWIPLAMVLTGNDMSQNNIGTQLRLNTELTRTLTWLKN